jgi:single-strand DNA-binding protein
MSVNQVIVIGNLGANPNIRALPSGQNVANFSLATTERFTDRNGAKPCPGVLLDGTFCRMHSI